MTGELYIVLRPSKIHGVGVFTERLIRRGELLKIWDGRDWRKIRKPRGRLFAMCSLYGVEHSNGYSRPKSFVRMSLAWYLNHSESPNCLIEPSGHCRAQREIRAGDELTIDYANLDPEIDNSEGVSP
jgi:SET domain-containing protein